MSLVTVGLALFVFVGLALLLLYVPLEQSNLIELPPNE
jgi:hypothetical protein